MDNITGVDYLDITKMTITPVVSYLTWTGDAEFSDITLSEDVLREEWEVYFFNDTEFRVTGSVSGIQAATGTVDSEYTSDNGEITFTITSNAIDNSLSDRARFRTSPYSGNIWMYGGEFPIKGTFTLNFYGGA